jgi:hypothetical protein
MASSQNQLWQKVLATIAITTALTFAWLLLPDWLGGILMAGGALLALAYIIGNSVVLTPVAKKSCRVSFGKRVAGGVLDEGLGVKAPWETIKSVSQIIETFPDEIRIVTAGDEDDGMGEAEGVEIKFPTFVKYRRDPDIRDAQGRPRTLEVSQQDIERELSDAAETVAATIAEGYRLDAILRHKPELELMYECALRLGALPHLAETPAPHGDAILAYYANNRTRIKSILATMGQRSHSAIEKWNGVEVLQTGMGAPILPEKIASAKEEDLVLQKYGEQVDKLAARLAKHGIPADVIERRVASANKLGGEMSDSRVNGLEGLLGKIVNKFS